MPIVAHFDSRRRFNPMTLLAVALVVGGLYTMLRARVPSSTAYPLPYEECDEDVDPLCAAVLEEGAARRTSGGQALGEGLAAPTTPAADACPSAGYLCAELEPLGFVDIRRWKNHEGTIMVHIPLPPSESRGDARRLQSAAAAGVRAWNGQPFPISVDERGNREADVEVRWVSSLSGLQIGLARTQWSPTNGLEVTGLTLATRSPHNRGQVIDPRQIRLTAAHEMGHALGILMHSDSDRDVMYPTNTATSLSAQDYRTMEVLYSLEDGTRIIR
jgi:Matrixin